MNWNETSRCDRYHILILHFSIAIKKTPIIPKNIDQKKKRINNYIYIFLLGWAFAALKKSAFSSISWSSPKYSQDIKVIFQKVKAELLQKSLRHLLQLSFKYLVFIFLPSAKKKMFNQVTVDTGVNMWLFIWEFNVTWKSPFFAFLLKKTSDNKCFT